MSGDGAFDAFLPFLPVHDLAATRDFYARDLGLRPARDQGDCLIFHAGGGYVGFCQREGALPRHDGLILTFVRDDVDGLYRRLRRLGVETEGGPRLHPNYGVYHFFARDPDGYRVEIQRFATPLPDPPGRP